MAGKGDSRCAVLVASCDAYHDLESPFASLFAKYWPDCPFELILLTESVPSPGFDRCILAGRGKTWCEMLVEALEQIGSPYVMLLMNDYLLCAPVDTARVLARLEEAVRFDVANLRLMPNPPGRRPWPGSDLMEMPKGTAYCVTCQVGIWRREFLAGIARLNRSAWEFERLGSFMAGGDRPLLVTRTKEFPFVDAVHKGYWERFGIELMRDNGVAFDLEKRGLPPLRVRLVEALKSFVFAVFPLTLVVRVQNALGVGKK